MSYAAERYSEVMRSLRADVGFEPGLNMDGSIRRCYRGPRGEAGWQPIYGGQVPERQEIEDGR